MLAAVSASEASAMRIGSTCVMYKSGWFTRYVVGMRVAFSQRGSGEHNSKLTFNPSTCAEADGPYSEKMGATVDERAVCWCAVGEWVWSGLPAYSRRGGGTAAAHGAADATSCRRNGRADRLRGHGARGWTVDPSREGFRELALQRAERDQHEQRRAAEAGVDVPDRSVAGAGSCADRRRAHDVRGDAVSRTCSTHSISPSPARRSSGCTIRSRSPPRKARRAATW